MSATSLEPVSILAFDIGTFHTRAFLFDVVEDSYHLIASGMTRSTYDPPLADINIGIQETIEQLQQITGRILLDQRHSLIIPSQAGSEGVDRLYITHSFGPFIKIATFGLSSDVSLKSINKLGATTYGTIVASVGIDDKRTINDQIDDVVHAAPDLLLFAGGTDQGSSRAVRKMAGLIGAILQLIPQDRRPQVIYSGNQSMAKTVKDTLGQYTRVNTTINLRPTMDDEKLSEVTNELADLFTSIRGEQYTGIKKVSPKCSDSPCPSTVAIGRVVQFLSEVGDPEKGIMGIDIGSGSTVVASACAGKLDLNAFPMGMGAAFKKFLEVTPFDDISRWFPAGIAVEEARDQLWQKTVFPRNIPETPEGLAVEQAAARQLLVNVLGDLSARGLLVANGYDTILCSGMTLTQMGTPEQILMMLLDGIQPVGVTSFVLDRACILPSLGAASRVSPIMPIQVLESTVFTNLASVITVTGTGKPGATLMRARISIPNEQPRSLTIKQGDLIRIPLKRGLKATVQFDPSRNAQVEANMSGEAVYRVNGGVCGLVIDARGRPIKLPSSTAQREQMLRDWAVALKWP